MFRPFALAFATDKPSRVIRSDRVMGQILGATTGPPGATYHPVNHLGARVTARPSRKRLGTPSPGRLPRPGPMESGTLPRWRRLL